MGLPQLRMAAFCIALSGVIALAYFLYSLSL